MIMLYYASNGVGYLFIASSGESYILYILYNYIYYNIIHVYNIILYSIHYFI